jgi:glycosyltransferase involved in cell wall biosynthesis
MLPIVSKVFVLTSRSEGMSIALMEAMGCGVPAVAADVGELSDLVVSRVNGWLVQANDLGEYVERITGLLDDPVNWQRISSAACEARNRTEWTGKRRTPLARMFPSILGYAGTGYLLMPFCSDCSADSQLATQSW